MEKRGRKSGASMEVVKPVNITAIERPAAPGMLTKRQAGVWETVVGGLPADWFPAETHELLAQYCRHAINARRVAQLIENLLSSDQEHDDWLAEYNRLLIMHEREGRALSSLATRMRLTQQTRYHPEKKRGTSVRAPWLPPHKA
jgi:hypothetical protein